MTFKDLGLIEPILRAVTEKGYTTPTPIQQQSIPILLKKKDLLGCAQTGTGKTAAFTIPILQHLATEKQTSQKRQIKSLIVTPTRELALQIEENIKEYGKYTSIKSTVIFGGVNQNPQVNRLRQGIDILVATPGRLLDLINQGFISLSHVEYFVLDEADQMLDMGFIHDIKKIIAKLPRDRQSLFFSATMAKPIVDLSNQILGHPEKVTIKPEQTTADKVTQSLYMVSNTDKINLLVDLIKGRNAKSVLVFSRTKHGANKVVKLLDREEINSAAIHGNKTQAARVKALNGFKDGSIKVLVATDIAARGIDVSELELVVNYDLPNIPETYVHRIGRTGRAKASGEAVSFCSAEERSWLRAIEKLIRTDIPLVKDHPYHDTSPEEAPPKQGGGGGRRQGGGNRNPNKPKVGAGKRPQGNFNRPRRRD